MAIFMEEPYHCGRRPEQRLFAHPAGCDTYKHEVAARGGRAGSPAFCLLVPGGLPRWSREEATCAHESCNGKHHPYLAFLGKSRRFQLLTSGHDVKSQEQSDATRPRLVALLTFFWCVRSKDGVSRRAKKENTPSEVEQSCGDKPDRTAMKSPEMDGMSSPSAVPAVDERSI